jgi:hypothetical protein
MKKRRKTIETKSQEKFTQNCGCNSCPACTKAKKTESRAEKTTRRFGKSLSRSEMKRNKSNTMRKKSSGTAMKKKKYETRQ